MYFAPQQLSPRILDNLYHRYRNADAFTKDYVHSAFEEFCGLRDFNRSAMMNYSFYDLFYWEHRSGAWQALALQDWDAAQNTSILYNNRRLLQQLLSVPLEHRAKDTVHSLILKHLLPGALESTSIPHPTPSRKSKIKGVRHLLFTLSNNLKRSMFLRYN
jgi:hypothetical protein